jgi:hypothetical protein
MRSPPIHLPGRISRRLFAGVLALAVFVVGHNLYFLIRYGSGYASEMARTGDGNSWDSTVGFVLVAAALLACLAAVRLGFLLRQVQSSDLRQQVAGLSATTYVHALVPIWLGLLSASIPLFILQENFERWSAGLPMPGLSVIGVIELKSPALVFALVSLAFALVVALFRLSIERLEALIARGRTRAWVHAPAIHRPGPAAVSIPASIISRNLAGRAPPQLLPA